MSMVGTIRRWWGRMIGKATIEQALNITVIRDPELERLQGVWKRVREGSAEWNSAESPSLFLAASLGREVANTTTFERKTEISGNDALNEQYQAANEQMPDAVNDMYCLGSVVLKPYVRGDRIFVTIATPDRYWPLKYNEIGQLVSCAFGAYLKKADDSYTLIEIREWIEETQTATFSYRAFKSNMDGDIGQEVPLSSVPEWSNLQPEMTSPDIPRPLFVEMNMKDKRSGYANAVDAFRRADEQAGRYEWEFVAGEMAIDASIDLFRATGRYNQDGTPERVLPKGKERLYRFNDKDAGADGESMKAWTPELRDANIAAGINTHKQAVEDACGVSRGTISDVAFQDKTATEIRSTKQRFLITIRTLQNIVKKSYTELAEVMDILGRLYVLFPQTNYEVSFEWGDSVLEDPQEENARRKEQLAMGIITREAYYAWYYGVTEDEAKKRLPPIAVESME